ncbi:FkbM family methyltransferase, partial [Campylobacter helveticus]|uniref:FkbM family methyltransferase n=1 Tax=Campylobacter helveticus TaxID=28898 RepID=UPI001112BEA6
PPPPPCQSPLCIDCGAHAGLISDIILHCGGRVECFEPNLYLNFFLKRKFENNAFVKIHQKAVSNQDGKVKFLTFQNRILSQGNRIVKSVQDEQTHEAYEVECVNLCEFLEQKERIYLLKLDVEGAEFEILPDLIEKKLYEKIDYIVVETHEYMFKDGVEKLKVIKKELEKRGVKNIFLDWC